MTPQDILGTSTRKVALEIQYRNIPVYSNLFGRLLVGRLTLTVKIPINTFIVLPEIINIYNFLGVNIISTYHLWNYVNLYGIL